MMTETTELHRFIFVLGFSLRVPCPRLPCPVFYNTAPSIAEPALKKLGSSRAATALSGTDESCRP